jgi:hypothetical protein
MTFPSRGGDIPRQPVDGFVSPGRSWAPAKILLCNLLLILLACASSAPAAACSMPEHERTIFFEQQDVANPMPGEVIIDLTIEAIITLPDYRTIAVAYINETIKGSIAGAHVGIALAGSNCDRGFAVGARGYVLGKLVRTAYGGQAIVPFSERFTDRERRRRSEAARRARAADPSYEGARVVLDGRKLWLRPSEAEENAGWCDIPRSERTSYGRDPRNIPDDCLAWSDGCNSFLRDESGGITHTLSMCPFNCPSIMCTHYFEAPQRRGGK